METEAKDHRPSWDEYFMTLATEVATRTTCLRRGVGALIVKDRRILATGYNGVPTGLAHCSETGCLRQQLDPDELAMSMREEAGMPRRVYEVVSDPSEG